jgi:excisionase family DNA binding protein
VSGTSTYDLDGTHLAPPGVMPPQYVSRAPLLLTVPDTARRLQRHEQTVRAMIRRGDLAAVRLGRLVRVLAAAVDRSRVLADAATVADRPRLRRISRA